jgi:tetratricopeptide (TPR) repeat protein
VAYQQQWGFTTVWQRNLRTALIVGVVLALLAGAFWKPISVSWRLRQARSRLNDRDSEDAVEILQSALQLAPENPEVHFLLARSYRRLGQFSKVIEHLDEAEGWGWPSELIRLEQLMGAAQAGQLQASAPALYRFLGKGGDYGDEGPEVCEALVNGYFLSYQFGLAQPLLDEWQEAYPGDAQCYLFRGLYFENRSNPTKAVAEYRKAVQLAGGRTDVRLRLAEVLKKSNQFDEAIEQFEICRSEDSDHPEVLTGLGQCFRGQGRIDDARRMFETVLEETPDFFDAQLALGQLEETAGKADRALRWLRPACRRNPSDTEVRYSLARSLQVVGREYREAVRQPAKGKAGLSLVEAARWAAAWARAELTLSEASTHFRFVADAQQAMGRVQVWTDLVRSEPRNVELRFKIGDHLMTYDNPEHGLGWMLSALDIDPAYAPAHRALATYYDKRGKPERAALHRQQAGESGGSSGSDPDDSGNVTEPPQTQATDKTDDGRS